MLHEDAEQGERVEMGSLARAFRARRQRSNRAIELVPGPSLIDVVGREDRRRRPERLQHGDVALGAPTSCAVHRILGAALAAQVDGRGRNGVEAECPDQTRRGDRGEHFAVAGLRLRIPVLDPQAAAIGGSTEKLR